MEVIQHIKIILVFLQKPLAGEGPFSLNARIICPDLDHLTQHLLATQVYIPYSVFPIDK